MTAGALGNGIDERLSSYLIVNGPALVLLNSLRIPAQQKQLVDSTSDSELMEGVFRRENEEEEEEEDICSACV